MSFSRSSSCLQTMKRPLRLHHLRQASTASGSGYNLPTSSAPSSADIASAKSYCTDLLKKYDSPSYTLLPFIPPPTHAAYLALRAFNLEIARIPDTASNPSIAALRFQFWHDTINATFSLRPPAHPISILLSHALSSLRQQASRSQREPLSKSWFLRIISAREQYANGKPYTTLDELEKYAESTYSTLLYLTLQALPLTSLTADHLASHIGKAAGIAAVLRGLPLLAFPGPANHHANTSSLPVSNYRQRAGGAKQGAVTLPLDVMAEAGVCEEDVLRHGASAPGLRDAVFTVATRASDHLITARTMLANVRKGEDVGHDFEHEGEEGHDYSDAGTLGSPKEEANRAFRVLMPAVSTQLWLERLQKVDFDIFREELRGREWRLPWRAYWAFRRKMF